MFLDLSLFLFFDSLEWNGKNTFIREIYVCIVKISVFIIKATIIIVVVVWGEACV